MTGKGVAGDWRSDHDGDVGSLLLVRPSARDLHRGRPFLGINPTLTHDGRQLKDPTAVGSDAAAMGRSLGRCRYMRRVVSVDADRSLIDPVPLIEVIVRKNGSGVDRSCRMVAMRVTHSFGASERFGGFDEHRLLLSSRMTSATDDLRRLT